MSQDTDTQTVEVPLNQLNDYARAMREPSVEAVENLGKSEALFWALDYLGLETPEGHPSDHNGNVTRAQIKAIASELAAQAEGDD